MARFRIGEGNRGPLGGQGIGQYGQNRLNGLIEVQGLADNLTNLAENLYFQFIEVSFHMSKMQQEICLRQFGLQGRTQMAEERKFIELQGRGGILFP
jgi:hypothetical protein